MPSTQWKQQCASPPAPFHHHLCNRDIWKVNKSQEIISILQSHYFPFIALHTWNRFQHRIHRGQESIFHMKLRFADHLTCYFSSCDPMKYLEHFTTVKAAIKWSCFYLLIYCIIIIIIFSLASHPGSSGILTHTRSIPSGNILPSRACTRERFLLNQPSVSIWMTIQHKPIKESQGSNNCLQKYLCMFWGF